MYRAHQSRKYSSWKSSPAPAVGISVEQGGETRKAEDGTEVPFFFTSSVIPVRRRNCAWRLALARPAEGSERLDSRARAGGVVAVGGLAAQNRIGFLRCGVRPPGSGAADEMVWGGVTTQGPW